MDSLLLYTTVGKSEEYLKCLEWFCKSLTYTTRATLHLLVICDVSFHFKVVSILNQYAFLNYYLMDVPNSTTPVEASMHKVKIFDFPQIFHFRNALYVDLDCLFLGSLSFLFKKKIEDNKLYVFAEKDAVENNNLIPFSLSRENNKDLCYYREEHWNFLKKHNKLPFNAGLFMFRCSPIMEQHFRKLNEFIKNFKGDFFYEQSFMNTYFHLNNVSDYSMFDKTNIFMLKEHKLSDVTPEHNIIHFNCHISGEGDKKAVAMAEYFTQFKESHPAGFAQFDTRDEMIDQLIPSGGTIVEIGVFQGDFAEVLAKANPKHLYLVDCWEGGIGSGDVDGNNFKNFSSGEELWNSVKARYEFYPNISIHRQYSSEFLKSLKDSSIDVIYIDGDHSYKGVKEDLNNAFPKVKKGGWIMGHDYEMNMKKAKTTYEFGVKQAVDEFCTEKGLKLFAKGMDGCVSYAIFVDFDAKRTQAVEPTHQVKTEKTAAKTDAKADLTLTQLAEHHGVDKCPAISHSYTPVYDTLLSPLRKTTKSVLEIGIGNVPLMKPIVGEHYKPGASLRMWRDYFPNAQVIGCDIMRSVLFNDEERIKTFFVDQSNTLSLLALMDAVKPITSQFDIIVDDGSHIEEHMSLSFRTLWKFIKPNGGIYIIEDVKRASIDSFVNLGRHFIDAELLYAHKGLNTWDGFVAFRKL